MGQAVQLKPESVFSLRKSVHCGSPGWGERRQVMRWHLCEPGPFENFSEQRAGVVPTGAAEADALRRGAPHEPADEHRMSENLGRVLGCGPRDGLQRPHIVLSFYLWDVLIPLQALKQIGEGRQHRIGERVS